MTRVSASAKVKQKFDSSGDGVKLWFEYLPEIIDKLDNPGIALAYCFQQIESGHRRAIYAGLLRKYQLHPETTWKKIDSHEMFIGEFKELFEKISLLPLRKDTYLFLDNAVKIRNKVTHGQEVRRVEQWKAVLDCLAYADDFNAQNRKKSGFDVFGSLQGITSSSKTRLTVEVTELVLIGLGFIKLPSTKTNSTS